MPSTVQKPRSRTRRSTAEVREAMLRAAGETFSRYGYAAARTKSIAEAAGVSERLIFEHFGSKRLLFEEAVLTPLREFLMTFIASLENQTGEEFGPGEEFENFVDGFFRVLLANRRLLVAYVAASSFHGDEFEALEPAAGLEASITRLRGLAERLAHEHDFTLTNVAVHVRVIVATLLGLTVFDDLLFPGRSIDEETIVTAASDLMLRGFMGAQDR